MPLMEPLCQRDNWSLAGIVWVLPLPPPSLAPPSSSPSLLSFFLPALLLPPSFPLPPRNKNKPNPFKALISGYNKLMGEGNGKRFVLEGAIMGLVDIGKMILVQIGLV